MSAQADVQTGTFGVQQILAPTVVNLLQESDLQNQGDIETSHGDSVMVVNPGQQNVANKENRLELGLEAITVDSFTRGFTTSDEEVTVNTHGIEKINPVDVATLEPQFTSTGLEAYLRKSIIGKEIFKCCKKCLDEKRPFPRNIRSKLTRLVIQREKDWALRNITPDGFLNKFEIPSARFITLAHEITTIFKYENETTYYTPSQKFGKKFVLASGKLWNHFNYVKDCLRQASLLVGKEEIAPVEINVSNNDDEKINWLSSNIDPWTDVVQYWNETYAVRRTLYLLNTDFTVQDYFDKFKCLSTQEGKELFLLDFERLYKDKVLIGHDKWKKIKTILTAELIRATVKNPVELGFINCLKSGDLSQEKENFLLLYLLTHLLPPKRSGRKRKQHNEEVQNHQLRKLSLEERRDSFILHVQTATEIEPRLLEFKNRLLQDGATFQPLIVAVGLSIMQIESYYIAVNRQLYLLDNCLETVALALKIFFTLDFNYPANTQVIWVFLQKILLNINLPSDVVTIQMNVLLGLIEAK